MELVNFKNWYYFHLNSIHFFFKLINSPPPKKKKKIEISSVYKYQYFLSLFRPGTCANVPVVPL